MNPSKDNQADSLMQALRNARSKIDITIALERIAEQPYPFTLDPLFVQYLGDSRWLVRTGAIQALGNCSDQKAADLLLEFTKHTTDPFELVYLNVAFGRLRAVAATEFLVSNLQHRKVDVACTALASLTSLAPDSVLTHLLAALEDRRWPVKLYAMHGIEKHGDASAIGPVLARVKKILSKERRINMGSRTELAAGFAFLWRFHDVNPEVAMFFSTHLPTKQSRLTQAEKAELDRLLGS